MISKKLALFVLLLYILYWPLGVVLTSLFAIGYIFNPLKINLLGNTLSIGLLFCFCLSLYPIFASFPSHNTENGCGYDKDELYENSSVLTSMFTNLDLFSCKIATTDLEYKTKKENYEKIEAESEIESLKICSDFLGKNCEPRLILNLNKQASFYENLSHHSKLSILSAPFTLVFSDGFKFLTTTKKEKEQKNKEKKLSIENERVENCTLQTIFNKTNISNKLDKYSRLQNIPYKEKTLCELKSPLCKEFKKINKGTRNSLDEYFYLSKYATSPLSKIIQGNKKTFTEIAFIMKKCEEQISGK